MNFDEVLQTRRSIRSYRDEKVPHEVLEELIKSVQYSPSWKNQQTTRFYVLESKESMDQMRNGPLAPFNAKRTMLASNYIIVTFVKDVVGFNDDGQPTNELGNGWGCYDAGIATQSLVLKAKDLGLGTLIMGIRDAAALRKNFNIPKTEQIVAVIAVGYGETAKAWSSEDAKGFIKVTSTALRAYYLAHPDEER